MQIPTMMDFLIRIRKGLMKEIGWMIQIWIPIMMGFLTNLPMDFDWKMDFEIRKPMATMMENQIG